MLFKATDSAHVGGVLSVAIGGSANNAIDAFTIDPETGVLTSIASSHTAHPNPLNSLTVDVSGGFLYAAAQVDMQADSVFFGFSINPSDGSLTSLATSPYPAPTFPVDAVSLNIP